MLLRQCFIDYENEIDQTYPASMTHIITGNFPTARNNVHFDEYTGNTERYKTGFGYSCARICAFCTAFLGQYYYAQNHWCDKSTNEEFESNKGFGE